MRRDCVIALAGFLLTLACIDANAGDASAEALWAKLKSGNHVVLIRHTETDAGVGDPPGFDVSDCATQRNLSALGRSHAQRIGAAFKAHGIPVAQVLSSRWCRCVDTARLAFGNARADRMLDSLFNDNSRPAEEKLRDVQAAINQPRTGGNLVLVTHNYNIDAVAGISTAPGASKFQG